MASRVIPPSSSGLRDQRQQVADVIAGGQLWHDAAVARMQSDLAVQRVREQAALGGIEATPVSSQDDSMPKIVRSRDSGCMGLLKGLNALL
jgi:hypothetical protein